MKGQVIGKLRTGHGVADHIQHWIKFDKLIDRVAFQNWLNANTWLGYHPAGYGPEKLYIVSVRDKMIIETIPEPDEISNMWVYQHYASCD
jgi:hypothetical protein